MISVVKEKIAHLKRVLKTTYEHIGYLKTHARTLMLTPMTTKIVCYAVDQHPITLFTFARIVIRYN